MITHTLAVRDVVASPGLRESFNGRLPGFLKPPAVPPVSGTRAQGRRVAVMFTAHVRRRQLVRGRAQGSRFGLSFAGPAFPSIRLSGPPPCQFEKMGPKA